MKYVFGPISSRRLGKSLGVDPIPSKTCNWNCVYCQLGRTRPLANERKEFVSTQEIVSEIREAVCQHKPSEIDWISFVGSGEPTLHAGIGRMIREVKSFTEIPVAVITNGSLLSLPEVRADLQPADTVLPTLSAGSETLFRTIHRPHPDLTFAKHVDGLKAFRDEYHGKLWVEVMLLKEVNDSEEELRKLADILRDLSPDAVHLVLPTRPAAESWVKLPEYDGLMRAQAIFAGIAEIVHPAKGTLDLNADENIVQSILNVISRHPVMHQELEEALNAEPKITDPESVFAALRKSEQAQEVLQNGVLFWASSSAKETE
ncbi:Radical SAM domain protein [Chloroherpeton thalassium ATCC 35110]|uniref:Radical SAM domain protein n=1 Tax=Chloroherpeton thalassium (strain ATCC 35110 / GB-78) TaxID=517418 RepID=B3QST9_CHLT3|nr:radical SAM protein [Chloroherpeton thalassium]ACF12582.1 Radical SAM domain protein [Chloroherpeton thalassium ATCC 35110]